MEKKNLENSSDRNKIANCIPTYNRPEIMEDVLGEIQHTYKKYGIDIYIYDSSEDDRTYWVVKRFIEQGMDNLYYVRIHPEISIDEKLIMIFQGYELKHDYTYIWIVKDRAYVPESTLIELYKEMDQEFDAIFIDTSNVIEDTPDIKPMYSDAGEFYGVMGWLATSMNTTIYSYDKLLKKIDWQVFRQKYFFEGENQFDHFTVLFDAIGNREHIRIRRLYGDKIKFINSYLGKSTWAKRTFRIWGDLWPRVNEALPSCYDQYKKKVIKKTASLPWILGSVDALYILRDKGILDKDTYEVLKNRWEELSDIPVEEFKAIACNEVNGLTGKHATLWEILDFLLEQGRYEDVCDVFYAFSWMKGMDEGQYILFGECVKIYMIEKKENVEKTIFFNTTRTEETIQKYMMIKHMFQKIEYVIDVGKQEAFCNYIQKNNISSHFIMYIVMKHCSDYGEVSNKFLKIMES